MEEQKPDVEYNVVFVTPRMASEWLTAAKGRPQRAINPTAVARYAADMRDGRWSFEGNPIRFDTDGILCDGQHRLTAIVMVQIGQWMAVLSNVKREAFSSIDGGQQRTLADILTIEDTRNAAILAAIAGRVVIFESGPITRGNVRQTRYRWSRGKMAEYVKSVEDEVSGVISFAREAGKLLGMEQRVAGALFVLIRRKDKESADEFIGHVLLGANLNEGHPALTLRNWLSRNKSENSSSKVITDIYAFVTAWNAYRRGMPLKTIRIPAGVTIADENGKYVPVPELV